MNFTVGDIRTLSDQQLFTNLALLKQDKVNPDLLYRSKEDMIKAHENVLKSRGYDDDDIDIKVNDLIEADGGDINGGAGKFWTTTDKLVDTAGDIADVVGKFKGFFTKGGTYEDDTDGSTYDVKPKTTENFNWKPYIIGGVLFFTVSIGALVLLSKKGKK